MFFSNVAATQQDPDFPTTEVFNPLQWDFPPPESFFVLVDEPFPTLTLPSASGGTGPNPVLEYAFSANSFSFEIGLPAGLRYDSNTRTITGRPTEIEVNFIIFRVKDVASNQSLTWRFTITVTDVLPPHFDAFGEVIDPLIFTVGLASSQTLPQGSDGKGALTYTIEPRPEMTPALEGLMFVAGTSPSPSEIATPSKLQGTPTTPGTHELTLSATDERNEQGSLRIPVIIRSGPLDYSVAPEDQLYTPNEEIAQVQALRPAAGGAYPISYTLTPHPPAGLSFVSTPTTNTDLGRRALIGTPTEEGVYELTLRATDFLGATASSSFRVTVAAPLAFDPDALPVPPQTFTAGAAITPLTLPGASGGRGELSFSLTRAGGAALPDHLSFIGNSNPPTLMGTPALAAGTTNFVLTVRDSIRPQPNTASLSFSVVVELAPACARTPQVRDAIVAALAGINDCAAVSDAHLASISTLSLSNRGVTVLQTSDFIGLSALRTLDLSGNSLRALPEGIFDQLTALQHLMLGGADNRLETLPVGLFDALLNTLRTLDVANSPAFPLPVQVGAVGAPAVAEGQIHTVTLLLSPAARPFAVQVPYTVTLEGGATLTDFISPAMNPACAALGNGIVTIPAGETRLELRFCVALNHNKDEGKTMRLSLGNQLLVRGRDGEQPAADFPLTQLATLSTDAAHRSVTVALDGPLAFNPAALPVPPQTFTAGTPITPLTLPAASGGRGQLAYTLSLDGGAPLPNNLRFVDTFNPPILVGTPNVALEATDFALSVRDSASPRPNTASLRFSVVIELLPLGFHPAAVATQTYTVGRAIQTLLLPTARGGISPLTYSLAPHPLPAGLSFDNNAIAPTLSGTPRTAAGAIDLTLSLSDNASPPRSTSLSFRVVLNPAPVCERTPQVRDAIVAALAGISDCADVHDAHLGTIASLNLSSKGISLLRRGDFSGLSGLQELFLNNNSLSALPEGVFDPLRSLRKLWLYSNNLHALPEGVFDQLHTLEDLLLFGNSLGELYKEMFDELHSLEILNLAGNDISAVPERAFDTLRSLQRLLLDNNGLRELPEGVFDQLSSLDFLNLSNNSLSTLPTGVFAQLSSLEELFLQNNDQLSELPAGIFDNLHGLHILFLRGNNLRTLPEEVFDDLHALQDLDLSNNKLNSLPAELFDGFRQLFSLKLGGVDNRLGALPAGFFDTLLGTLRTLDVTRSPTLPLSVQLGVTAETSVVEGQSHVVTLHLSPAARPFAVQVPYTVTLGGGARLADFTSPTANAACTAAANGTVTIPAGATSLELRFCVATDDNTEAGETFSLSLGDMPKVRGSSGEVPHQGFPMADLASFSIDAGRSSAVAALNDPLGFDPDALPVPPQTFTAGMAITTLTLPAASGGRGALSFTLSLEGGAPLPNHLSFVNSSNPPTLIGTPAAEAGATGFVLTVSDSASPTPATAKLRFNVVVNSAPVCGRTTQVRDAIVTEVGVSNCATVSDAHLSELISLNLSRTGTTVLQPGDFSGLSSLQHLLLAYNDLRTLPEGVFDSLSSLQSLSLHENLLNALPQGVFDQLRSLQRLFLSYNDLNTLPVGVFDSLPALQHLDLGGADNHLGTLPAGLFDPLLNTLTVLGINESSTFPLPVQIGVTAKSNVVEGLTHTVTFHLSPAARPFDVRVPYTLSLGDGVTQADFTPPESDAACAAAANGTATIPAGATTTELHFCVALDDDAESGETLSLALGDVLTIRGRAGEQPHAGFPVAQLARFSTDAARRSIVVALHDPPVFDPDALPVPPQTFTAGTTIPPLTLPGASGGSGALSFTLTLEGGAALPNHLHFVGDSNPPTLSGTPAEEASATDYVLTVRDATRPTPNTASLRFRVVIELAPACARTPQVRDAIVAAAGVSSCVALSAAHLGAITSLDLSDQGITALLAGDFSGLSALEELVLSENSLSTLPIGVFDSLHALQSLSLHHNNLHTLPAGEFDQLNSLQTLRLNRNSLTSLPEGVFDQLSSLQSLYLAFNQLSALPEGMFDSLSSLRSLDLSSNNLRSLPKGVFDGLHSLQQLGLVSNGLRMLPEGAFDSLRKLTLLALGGADNLLETLPVGLFDAFMSTLTTLLVQASPTLPLPVQVGVTAEAGATEGQTHSVTFRLSPAARPFDVRVPYTLSLGGGATTADFTLPGSDAACAAPEDGSVIIPAGETSLELRFCIAADTETESAETMRLTLGDMLALQGSGGEQPHLRFPLSQLATFSTEAAHSSVDVGIDDRPAFDPAALPVSDQSYTAGQPDISPLTLPSASGGFGDLRYALPGLPEGMSFTAATRVLSGAPSATAATGGYKLGYTAIDENDATVGLTFNVTVVAAPMFAPGDTVPNQSYTATAIITTLSFPAARRGALPLRYTLSPDPPASLSFDGDADPPTLSGTPDAALDESTFSYTARDTNGASASLRFSVTVNVGSDEAGVCDRTPQVRDAIVAAVPGVAGCAAITAPQLAALEELELENTGLTTLKAGDFAGLSSLEELNLRNNQLGELPARVFDPLPSLLKLDLSDNNLSSLPEGVFDFAGLSSLKELDLRNNQLGALRADAFEQLPALLKLNLSGNNLSSLPEGVFDFAGTSSLEELDLRNNQLGALRAEVFDQLPSLLKLDLSNNSLPMLPAAVFAQLGMLRVLDLSDNNLSSLAAGVSDFAALGLLEELHLRNNQLGELPAGVFDQLPALLTLDLRGNSLDMLPEAVFEQLAMLHFLGLSDNNLRTLPEGLFDQFNTLGYLGLGGADNRLENLPPGLFDVLLNTLDILIVAQSPTFPLPVQVGVRAATSVTERQTYPVTFRLSPAARPFDVRVPYTLSLDGGAAVADFILPETDASCAAPEDGSVIIPAGATSLVLRFCIAADSASETAETIRLTLGDVLALQGSGGEQPHPSFPLTQLATLSTDAAHLSVDVGIVDSPVFDPAALPVPDQSYTAGQQDIIPLSLPGASGGFGDLRYALPGLPAGLSFSDDTRVLSGAPSATASAGDYQLSYTTIDENNTAVSLSFTITIRAPPSFPEQLDHQSWPLFGEIIPPLTLPEADNGTAPLSYRLRPLLRSLGFDPNKRTLSGALTQSVTNASLTFTATDSNNVAASLTFSVSSFVLPHFVATIPHQTFSSTAAIPTLSFPLASDGLGASRYTLSPDPPADLSFNGDATPPTLSGTPILKGAPSNLPIQTTFVYTATDTGSYTATLTFHISVIAAPTFAPGDTVPDQRYTATNAIPILSFPTARYGALPLRYTLSPDPPASLSFNGNGDPPTLSGTPDAALDETTFSYTARDTNGAAASLHFSVTVIHAGVCGRTPQVRDAIVAAVPGVAGCAAITALHLAAIEELELENTGLTALQAGDFAGLSSLEELNLRNNQLEALLAGVFDPLQSLLKLHLSDNSLSSLPAEIFDFSAVSTLKELDLRNNQLGALRAEVFDPLQSLLKLDLSGNSLPMLPAAVFEQLGTLHELDLSDNNLSALPEGIFDFATLSSLEELDLRNNQLGALRAGVFDQLPALLKLDLRGNSLPMLPAAVFAQLGMLRVLDLSDNNLSSLAAGVSDFAALGLLEELHLRNNQLGELPAGVFDQLPALVTLDLRGNSLATLPEAVFEQLGMLHFLALSGNNLGALPEGLFDTLNTLGYLGLGGENNRLENLPPGLFDALFNTLDILSIAQSPIFPLPVQVGVTAATSVTERQTYPVTFRLSPAARPFDVRVPYTFSLDGGATEADFILPETDASCAAPEDGSVIIPAGESSLELRFCIAADSATETSETMRLTLGDVLELQGSGGEQPHPSFPLTQLATLSTDAAQRSVGVGIVDSALFDPAALPIPNQTYTAGQQDITPLSLPGASGGFGDLRYALPGLPAGLSFSDDTRVLSGAPSLSVLPGDYDLRYTATDENDATISLGFSITVNDPPSFSEPVDDQAWLLLGAIIPPLTLPAADNGSAPLSYRLRPLPQSLSFDSNKRAISGALTQSVTNASLTFTATDSNDVAASLTFRVSSFVLPHFVSQIPHQTFSSTAAIPTLSFPEVRDGLGASRYTLSPDPPADLTFNGDATPPTLRGTPMLLGPPSNLPTQTTFTYTATDTGDNTATLTFRISVFAAPAFAPGDTVPDQRYTATAAITTLRFPTARYGALPLRYTLSPDPPASLSFDGDGDPPTLSGTPDAALAETIFSYTARDTNGAAASLSFSVTVNVGGDEAGVCDRTPQVRDAIVAAVPSVADCAAITALHLAAIEELELDNTGLTALQAGDFAGLSSLEELDLHNNQLGELPAGVFDPLQSLLQLDLHDNSLRMLPGAVFEQLGMLNSLDLSDNNLSSLPEGIFIFANIGSLKELHLRNNQLGALRAKVFAPLQSLLQLDLSDNNLSALPQGIFDFATTSSLEELDLRNNQLGALRAGVFDQLPALLKLDLSDNSLDMLPAALFEQLGMLRVLDLSDNNLSALPEGIFDFAATSSLEELNLRNNQLEALRAGVFAQLPALLKLDLSDNSLPMLPEKVFEQLGMLHFLDLSNNNLRTLPEGLFDQLNTLGYLGLRGANNNFENLPVGLFDALLNTLDILSVTQSPTFPLPVQVGVTSATSVTEMQSHPVTLHLSPAARPFDVQVPYTLSLSGGATVEDFVLPESDASCTAPEDGSVIIPAGETSLELRFCIAADTAIETTSTTETLRLTLGDMLALQGSGGEQPHVSFPLTQLATLSTNAAQRSVEVSIIDLLAFDPATLPIPNQTYTAGQVDIPPLTLPSASGGVGDLNYDLQNLPVGMSFTDETRVLSGAPSTSTSIGDYDLLYVATDENTGADSMGFTITVNAPPTFPTSIGDDHAWTANTPIPAPGYLQLPSASDGTPMLSYTLNSDALPTGLSFDDTNRRITGTPKEATSAPVEMIWRVFDANKVSAARRFTITLNGMPHFPTPLGALSFTAGTPYRLTLPTATGGTGDLSYALSRPYPPDSNYDQSNRVLSGNSRTESVTTLSYTATDTLRAQAQNIFTVTIVGGISFGADTVADQTYTVGQSNAGLSLPGASGGVAPLRYQLNAADLPPGLSYDDANQRIAGQPSAATRTPAAMTWTATDANSATGQDTFSITVVAAPQIVSTPATQTFTRSAAVNNGNGLQLPAASDGREPLRFTLSLDESDSSNPLPPGLSFHSGSHPTLGLERLLSGTPTASGDYELSYIVTDANDVSARATFLVRVVEAPRFAASIPDLRFTAGQPDITPLTLPQANDGFGTLTYALPGLPEGLSFSSRSRVLSGAPAATARVGNYDLRFTATDENGARASRLFTITVAGPLNFDGEAPPNLSFIAGTPIPATSPPLPEADGGTTPLDYALSPNPLPAMLSWLHFDPSTRQLSGTPTKTLAPTELRYIATDANSATTTLPLSLRVLPGDAAVGQSDVEVSGSPAIADGSAVITLRATVRDANRNLVKAESLSFAATDQVSFSASTCTTDSSGQCAITVTSLRAGTYRTAVSTSAGEIRTVEYSFLAGDADTVHSHVDLGGNPAIADGSAALTFTATVFDAHRNLVSGEGVSFAVTDHVSFSAPGCTTDSSGQCAITATSTTAGAYNTAVSIGAGEIRTVEYTFLAGDADPDASSLGIIGRTATAANGSEQLSFIATVRDANRNPVAGEIVRLAATPGVSFSATTCTSNNDGQCIITATSTTAGTYSTEGNIPAGAIGEVTYSFLDSTALVFGGSLADHTFTAKTPIATVHMPPASGGTNNLRYSLVPRNAGVLPVGLSFDAGVRTLSGTPQEAGSTDLNYTATDTSTGVTITLRCHVTVVEAPIVAVEDQTYTLDTPIPALTLPEASGGAAPMAYTLTPAPLPDSLLGLDYSAATRVLSGTPTIEGETELTYTVQDSNGATYSESFRVTVSGTLERLDALNRTILPEVVRVISSRAVSVISRRIEQAKNADQRGAATLGGQSTLPGVVSSTGRALAENSLDPKNILGGSNFVLPLNVDASSRGDTSRPSSLTTWGLGDYSQFSHKTEELDWDGELLSAYLGMDALLGANLLGGLVMSWDQSELEYQDAENSGEYTLELASVYPYAGWMMLDGQLDLWITAGFGEGDVEITDDVRDPPLESNLEMRLLSAGLSGFLRETDRIALRLKGDALQTQVEVEESPSIAAWKMKISRMRLALEASQALPLLAGAQLEPSAELGIRYDGGDGTTGSALEVGAALRYIDPQAGFSVAGNMHALIQKGDSQEWGVQGLMRFTQGQDGRGLSFRLHSGYGADARAAVQEIWKQDLYQPQGGDHDYAISLKAHLGYGVSAPTKRKRGLLTPYTEFSRAAAVTSYRLGLRWQLTSFAEFDLKWSADQRAAGRGGGATTDHAMQLKAAVRF